MRRILIALTLVMAGCSSEQPQPARADASIENLKTAHAVSFRRSEYYRDAAVLAQKERLGNLAALYRALARSEEIHTSGHELLLLGQKAGTDTTKSPHLPLGSMRQVLKMGLSLETTETRGIYPPMIVTAAKENWAEAGTQFEQYKKADERHLELLSDAHAKNGVLSIHRYCVCQTCGYVAVDQDTATACPVCAKNVWERFGSATSDL